ncbi:hypothetical protein KXW34_004915 [Aspergillus fumigatus]|nr:hypothetical protein KXW34_004915 [Aspergillus fumigatus]
MSRGSRARPLLDAPNPVDSLDDPTRDAARRPLESRNHGWDGRLPPEAACLAGKKWPAQSSHATRGDAALAFHIEPPTSTGPWSCVQTFPGPDLAGGGPILYGVVRALARAPIQSGPLRFARCLGRKGTWSLAPSRARRAGRPSKPAPACPPVPSARAAHRSLRQGARARPISAAGSVCLSVYRDGWIDVGGGCGCICTYIYGWMGGCLRIPTDGCRRRAMPASVEADGHVRVAASVPVDGARLSGADKGARAPANWSPLAPPVSVWVSLDPCVARPASVHGARPCLPAAGLPKGLPPTGHPAARPRGAPRRANSASQLAAARSPARLPLLLLLALLALPSSPSRARLSARLEGARLPGPQPPSTDSPQPGPSRAPPAALLLHIPTDLARPIIVRANVPGSERRSGGRPTCAGRPRAARAAMCPSQLVTALRHQAAAARESMEVEIPRGPAVTGAPPRLRRKVSGPPSKRPALPGPLMGGVCQQI